MEATIYYLCFFNFDSYTTYPSAYIVVNPNGRFSKHYYAGSQRIVSRIGDQDASMFDISPRPMAEGSCLTEDQVREAQIKDLTQIMLKADMGTPVFKDYEPEEESEALEEEQTAQRGPTTLPMYFYHPDHLGSSTFLTDADGELYQFYLNLPFGETMAEQHSLTQDYETPYKFNGKELDTETEMYYYGARYYDPRASIWVSVDPLMEKYPGHNPYVYCYQNPINIIDPTGMAGVGDEGISPRPIPTWLLRVLKGISAHRALTKYLRRIDPNERTWRANKAVNAPYDLTRPDAVYDNGFTGGVFELKPAPPSPSSINAAPEAKKYAESLNKSKNTNRFGPGTSGGAPAPFIGEITLTDETTGNKFFYTIPDPSSGAIFWSEYPPGKEREKQPVSSPVAVPQPQYIPITQPSPKDDHWSVKTLKVLLLGGLLFGTTITTGTPAVP